MSMGRWFAVAVMGMVLCAAGAAVRADDAPGGAAPAAAPKTHTVARGALSLDFSGDGVFEPVDPVEVRLRPRAFGGDLLVASSAADGKAVKKGEVVLEIDAEPVRRELAGAENDLVLARANTKKAKEDVRLGDAADAVALDSAAKELDNAKVALKWFEVAEGPDLIKQADLQSKMARDGIEDQQDELDQLKKMYKTEDLTTATADIVVKRAVRQLTRSQEMLGITDNQSRKIKEIQHPQTKFNAEQAVKKADVALEQLKVTQEQAKVARSTALVAAEIAQAKAEQKVSELKGDLAQLKVTAPADGVVYWGMMQNGAWQNPNPRALEKGEKVTPQQVVAVIAAPGKLRGSVAVAENKLAAIQPGQKATVTPKLLPQTKYDGTVSRIAKTTSTIAGASGFEVEIDLDAVDARLAPGMSAAIKIEAGKAENVLLVPTSAVEGGKVKVAAEGKAEEEREVVTGRTDGKMVEVVKGLAEGEKVVVKSSQ
jgi:multidrug efflux pump subunit AcrA (membrane-fusion protein)